MKINFNLLLVVFALVYVGVNIYFFLKNFKLFKKKKKKKKKKFNSRNSIFFNALINL
jgi:hypothetical protein